MDDGRGGERFGWIGGWLGGFVWVGILSVVFAVQQRFAAAGVGVALLGMAVAAVWLGAPWRHPDTPYWKLMLPVYAALLAAVGWLWWTWQGPGGAGLNVWHLPLLLLLLAPFQTLGRRRWNDPGR